MLGAKRHLAFLRASRLGRGMGAGSGMLREITGITAQLRWAETPAPRPGARPRNPFQHGRFRCWCSRPRAERPKWRDGPQQAPPSARHVGPCQSPAAARRVSRCRCCALGLVRPLAASAAETRGDPRRRCGPLLRRRSPHPLLSAPPQLPQLQLQRQPLFRPPS